MGGATYELLRPDMQWHAGCLHGLMLLHAIHHAEKTVSQGKFYSMICQRAMLR
jgi:hypothetical protein